MEDQTFTLRQFSTDREVPPSLREKRFASIAEQVKDAPEGSHFIYVLVDPDTNTATYYGRCKKPAGRYSMHISQNNGSSDVDKWIARLAKAGNLPVMEILCVISPTALGEGVPVMAAKAAEREFIRVAADCNPIDERFAAGPIANMAGNPRKFIP